MTHKARLTVYARGVREKVNRLTNALLAKADPNSPAYEVAAEMLYDTDTRLDTLIRRINNNEI